MHAEEFSGDTDPAQIVGGRRKGAYYECVGDSYLCYCCGDYRGYRSLDEVGGSLDLWDMIAVAWREDGVVESHIWSVVQIKLNELKAALRE